MATPKMLRGKAARKRIKPRNRVTSPACLDEGRVLTLWRNWMDKRAACELAEIASAKFHAVSEGIRPHTEVWQAESRSLHEHVDATCEAMTDTLNAMQEHLKSNNLPVAIAARLHASLVGIIPWRTEIVAECGVEGELLIDSLRDLALGINYEMFSVIIRDIGAAECLNKSPEEIRAGAGS